MYQNLEKLADAQSIADNLALLPKEALLYIISLDTPRDGGTGPRRSAGRRAPMEKKKPAPDGAGGKKGDREMTDFQQQFLNPLRREGTRVTLITTNGYQMRGRIAGFDSFVILLEAEGGGPQQLVYKHAVSTIAPEAQ